MIGGFATLLACNGERKVVPAAKYLSPLSPSLSPPLSQQNLASTDFVTVICGSVDLLLHHSCNALIFNNISKYQECF